jgi:hypothetical protein
VVRERVRATGARVHSFVSGAKARRDQGADPLPSPGTTMADDEAKQLDAARTAPWDERLAHKNWKARVEAYAAVATLAASATSASSAAASPALKEFGAMPREMCLRPGSTRELCGWNDAGRSRWRGMPRVCARS